MDCGADSITLTWVASAGAVFYIATATDGAGVVRTCNAMGNECKISGLHCSSNYTAFVIATNVKCNSSKSEIVSVETGMCLFRALIKSGFELRLNRLNQRFYTLHLHLVI